MILDNEAQRKVLSAALLAVNWPGKSVPFVATVIADVDKAQIAQPRRDDEAR